MNPSVFFFFSFLKVNIRHSVPFILPVAADNAINIIWDQTQKKKYFTARVKKKNSSNYRVESECVKLELASHDEIDF